MRLVLLAPAILFATCPAAGSVSGAEEPEPAANLEEICKVTKCRPPGTVKLMTEKGEIELEQPGAPYLVEGRVIVIPGDDFAVELDFAEEGKPATVSLPGDTPRPDHTIRIKFGQMDGEEGMLLSLQNGTGATVKYDAFAVLPDGRSGKTSSCAVMAGLGAFEMWPYAIGQMILENFRKLSESDSVTCE